MLPDQSTFVEKISKILRMSSKLIVKHEYALGHLGSPCKPRAKAESFVRIGVAVVQQGELIRDPKGPNPTPPGS